MLNARSIARLSGVHPDLVRVITRAAEGPITFQVSEGLRTLARQKELLAAGASKTMNSRHLTGHAVDLVVVVGAAARWDWPLYEKLATQVLAAATAEGVTLTWGGSWKALKDGPHFELSWKDYK